MGKEFPYLTIGRGRFLCREHGSFCASVDNYARACALCPDGEKARSNWQANDIDRAMTAVRNLQDRSARSAGMVASIFAGISALTLVLVSQDKSFLDQIGRVSTGFLLAAQLGNVLSVSLYLLSMGSVVVTTGRGASAEFMSKSLADWERYVAGLLHRFERRHAWAARCAFFGVCCLMLALVFAAPVCDIYLKLVSQS